MRFHTPGPEGGPLTAADHTRAEEAVAQRARTDNPPTPPQAAGRGSRPGLLSQMTENPLLSLFGTVIAVLLGFVLTTSNIRISETNDRITSLESKIDKRIDRLEDRMDGRMDRLDGRMDRLEDRMDRLDGRMDRLDGRIGSLEGSLASIDRKLTALIAALNKTDEVEGALSGDVSGIQTPQPLDEAVDP